MRRSIGPALLVLAALSGGLPGTTLAAEAPPAELRARTTALLRDLDRSLADAGTPFSKLQSDLAAVAVELEHAGLDSLASDARLGAGRALLRMSRSPDAAQQLNLAVAAALRARDPVREMRARLLLIELRVQTDPGLALQSVRAAMSRVRSLHSDGLLAEALYTEAHAQDAMGNFKDALVGYREAADLAGRAGAKPLMLQSLNQCAQSLRFLGRHPEALAITDSVITVARREGYDAALGRALFERASMLRTQRRLEPALAAIDEAIAIQRRRGDRGRLQAARLLRGNTLLMMSRFDAASAEADTLLAGPDIHGAPTILVRAVTLKGRALIALGHADEADTLLAGHVAEIERYRASLPTEADRAAAGEHVQSLYTTWTRAKLAIGRPGDAWVVAEAGHAVVLEQRLGIPSVPDLRVLQERLRETSAALIEFDQADPVSANVLIVTADTVAGFPLRGDGLVVSDLSAVTDRASAPQKMGPADSAATRIADFLLADVWPQLAGGTLRLVMIPPSRLEQFPFEVLPHRAGGAPGTLGERFAIAYVPSAAVFLALDRREVPKRGLTVVADPEVDAAKDAIAALDPELRGDVQRRLPGAREEAKRMKALGATVLVGRDATLERLLALPKAAVLHFATHAFEDPRDPSGGGLVLAGRDPILSPARAETLGLGADLVTLAGCNTLGTTSHPGEGTFGLARAFLVSGSRCVLTTRWDVSDRATAQFMREFYDALRAGMPRDQSLARARGRLVAAGFPPRDCWAFALVGVGDRPIAQWTSAADP